MALSRYFLVARCPCCCRPIWPGLMAKLLGHDPIGRAQLMLGEIAFIAGSEEGKKGWKPLGRFGSLDELYNATGGAAGSDAVAQLRKLGQKVLQRLWTFGLIGPSDLSELIGERKARNEPKTSTREVMSEREAANAMLSSGTPRRTVDRKVVTMPVRGVTRERMPL